MARFYRHPRILENASRAERVLEGLFRAYSAAPDGLPGHVRRGAPGGEPAVRALGDYLAGMTDRFALDEHRRLVES